MVVSNAQVLDYSTRIRIEKGNKITEKSLLIQVNKKEQNWLSDIKLNYKADQDLKIIEAYIIGPDNEKVRDLKKKEIETKSNISVESFYKDDYTKEFSLYWNQYPYRIKYKYRITENDFIYVARWSPVVFSDITTVKSSLDIEIPTGYKVLIDLSGDLKHGSSHTEAMTTFHWEIDKYKAVDPEIFSPPIVELIPTVSVVPVEFNYVVKGSSESWSSFGSWFSLLNEESDELPISEKIKVDELIEGVEDKKEIAKILYHYLQDNNRYINVAIDAGGLKPYPASYVCQSRYGDCKALTMYMKALLKYTNIPSYYTIINAGSNVRRINKKLPSQQFNHVILTIPIDEDTLWLENTSRLYPFNYLGTFTQNRYALLVDGDNSKLIKTPKLEMKDVLEKSTYIYKLDEAGLGSVIINKTIKGIAFERYKLYQEELSEKDKNDRISEDICLKDCDLENWEIDQQSRDDQELRIQLQLSCCDQFRKFSRMTLLAPKRIAVPEFENPNLRINPVRINYPVNKSDSLVYELSAIDKYDVQLPNDIQIDTEFGKYEERYMLIGNKVIIVKKYKLYQGDYGKELYDRFFKFTESIIEQQNKSVIVLTDKI